MNAWSIQRYYYLWFNEDEKMLDARNIELYYWQTVEQHHYLLCLPFCYSLFHVSFGFISTERYQQVYSERWLQIIITLFIEARIGAKCLLARKIDQTLLIIWYQRRLTEHFNIEV